MPLHCSQCAPTEYYDTDVDRAKDSQLVGLLEETVLALEVGE